MNELAKLLKDEHETYDKKLAEIERELREPYEAQRIRRALEEFLEFFKEIEEHFLKEERYIFPELDKISRGVPLGLVQDEHDDLKAARDMLKMVKKKFTDAIQYKDKTMLHLAVHLTQRVIKHIREHAAIEDEIILPLIDKLPDDKQKRIFVGLQNFDISEPST